MYISANKKIEKWDFQAGIRIENTQTEGNSLTLGQTYKTNYLELFPTLYAVYNPNENNSYSLNYGRRIQRPDYSSVNPFRYYSNPYAYSEGNPFLKPVFIHNLELSYMYKSLLQTVLQFSMAPNSFAQVTYLDIENHVQEVKRENYFDNYVIGIGQTVTYNKVNWLQSYTILSGYYNYSKSKIYPVTPKSMEGFSWGIQSNNTFILNKNKTLLSGFVFSYSAPNKGGELTENKSSTQLDVFFKMLFLDKKLQINLQANNLFKAYAYNNESIRNGVRADYKGYYDSQYFRISLAYRLGNSIIKYQNTDGSNKEEKGRLD